MERKVLVSVAVLATVIGAYAISPRTVQGVPFTPKERVANIAVASDDNPYDPGYNIPLPEGDFNFDMIKSWSGKGSKKAALVIQWNDQREDHALVFGYRWDGLATGADMIRAVVADNPQLYGLIQYTNVSSPTDPLGGYTINGFGWDRDGDEDIALKDTKDNQIYYSENGLFIHPRGYDPDKGGSSDYDYDDWVAVDKDDLWGAGWFESYWSYWVKGSQDATFSYSGWGASGRVLEDGCWDGWNFALWMQPSKTWKTFQAAPNPLPEGVAKEFKVDGLYYNLANYNLKKATLVAPFELEGETLTQYSGDIIVPEKITVGEDTYNVTEVKEKAFENANIGTVGLPSSITKIGDYAFRNSSLRQLDFEEGGAIPSLGKGVFSGCTDFSQFLIPAGTKVIPDELFKGTGLTEISLDGIESIGSSSFEDCKSLNTVTVAKTVKSIGSKSFSGCSGITDVTVNNTFPPSCAENSFAEISAETATLNVPIGYSQTYAGAIGWSVFNKIEEFSLAVNVGDRFDVDGISYIVTGNEDNNMTAKVTYRRTEDGKTDNASIKNANKEGYVGELTIPATVTYQAKEFIVDEIDEKAFYEASGLTSVSLPDGIKTIPPYVFYDCTSLASVKLPASVTELGIYAFTYCKALLEITLPEGLTSIGSRCFQNTGITNLNLPSSLSLLPDYCFYGSELVSLTIGDQIKSIGSNCFQNCSKLSSVVLPAGIESLPSSVFSNCSALKTINIPESVTSIGNSAFAGCSSLESIILPASLKALSSGMLQNCSSLKEVVVPSEITALQNQIFSGCSSLEKVTMSPEISTIPQSSFANCTNLSSVKKYINPNRSSF